MDFYPLTASNLAGYLASVPAMRERFTGFDDLEVVEVGDGNLNFVYVVSHRKVPAETVVVKQALPYLRAAGE
ncbi:MAG: S-methyl-5-thioribose kinase, partial [Burkholderiaceae bacterium]|nr:S-methyl-5-thioribose kinase [Burkholderiaceae bacterium]